MSPQNYEDNPDDPKHPILVDRPAPIADNVINMPGTEGGDPPVVYSQPSDEKIEDFDPTAPT
jgi:hypothetical protein